MTYLVLAFDEARMQELFLGNSCLGVIFVKDPKGIQEGWEDSSAAPFIRQGRIRITNASSQADINSVLSPLMGNIACGYEIHGTPTAEKEDLAYYAEIDKKIQRFIAQNAGTIRSAIILAPKTRWNVHNNVAETIYYPGIELFAGRYKERPGILVAAGPSLSKNIGVLHKLQGSAVIVAVGTIYGSLLRAGIKPDFVCTLDFHPMSAKYLEMHQCLSKYTLAPAEIRDTYAPDDTVLVAIPGAAPLSVSTWQGRKVFCGDPTLDFYLKALGEKRAQLPMGGSVAHLAFSLLAELGCKPIVMVGQDLCFSGNATHFPGAGLAGSDYVQRLRPPPGAKEVGNNVWEYRGQKFTPQIRKLKDVDGNDVWTDGHMAGYLTRLEQLIAEAKTHVIDATEGGLPKEGTERITLQQVKDRYCHFEFAKKPPLGRARKYYARVPSKEKVIAVLRESLERFDRLDAIYEEVCELAASRMDFSMVGTGLGEDADLLEAKFKEASEVAPDEHAQVAHLLQGAQLRKHVVYDSALDESKETKALWHWGANLDYATELRKGVVALKEMIEQAIDNVEGFNIEEARGRWLKG